MKSTIAALAALLTFASVAYAQPTDDATRAQAREILQRSIAFNSSPEGGQTPQLAAYLAELYRDGGFPAADVLILPLENTASLIVRYRGDGSGGRPILLLAHMDVVPALRADWERDPFTMVEENGYFFGRGSLDNKTGIAHITATLLRLKAEGFTPSRDLIVVFSGDEETLGHTVQNLLSDHRALLGEAEFALNSDAGGGGLNDAGAPMGYEMQTAEKTYVSYRLTARNPGGHSSLPRADNAIFDLADAINRVRTHQFAAMWNDTTLRSFGAASETIEGELGAALRRFSQRPGDRRAAAIISRDPSWVGQVRTTCVPTLLAGGHAENALPQSATVTVNCRVFPGVQVEDVQAELQRVVGANIEIQQTDPAFASDASPLREDVLAAVNAAVRAVYPNAGVSPGMSAGATDGVYFRGAGIPTYGVGGVFMKFGDDFAHGLNERVPVDGFYNGLTHWRVLIMTIAGPR
ncbi:peptidase M20 [alpha proteobacterium U9-1i]|nr:peptidase M20 [alpha proteobacterium U9-1i]